MKRVLAMVSVVLTLACSAQAETLIWNGQVDSNGAPTIPIELKIGQTYVIRVSGKVNLGKWTKNNEKLANDACWEFSPSKSVSKMDSVKNSLNVSICDGSYHPNHIYESKPFKALQNRIHFWINDTDYEDNTGFFHVQIFREDDSDLEE